jgi:hypothetical protein
VTVDTELGVATFWDMKTDAEIAARFDKYTRLTIRVSRATDMTRWLAVFAVDDGQIVEVTHQVALLLGRKLSHDEIKIGGCGFDARYHLGDDIQRALGRPITIDRL